MPKRYEVANGDCIHSIALRNGFFWETLWNHADNKTLKDLRKDPNILMAGDIVVVPDLEQREESAASDQRYKFQRKGVPAMFSLQLMEDIPPSATQAVPPSTINASGKNVDASDPEPADGRSKQQPRKNVAYRLFFGANIVDGTTDGEGKLSVPIPPDTGEVRVLVEPGTPQQTEMVLQLGQLDPIDLPGGVLKRLNNLGYDCGGAADLADPGVCQAISHFQQQHELTASGEIDQSTRDKLREVHGS